MWPISGMDTEHDCRERGIAKTCGIRKMVAAKRTCGREEREGWHLVSREMYKEVW